MPRQTPASQFTSRQPAALAGSVLTHLLVAGLLFVQSTVEVRPPHPTGLAVEIVFQPPAEPATVTPSESLLIAGTPEPPPEPMPAAPTAEPTPALPPPEPIFALPSPLPAPLETPRPPKPPPPPLSAPRPPGRPRPTIIAPPVTAPQSALPPAPAPTPPTEVPPAPMSAAWKQALAAWLATHQSYPDEARRRGAEGNVALRFTIDRAGRVLTVLLVRSSGSAILDAAAEAMLRGASVPSPPASMTQDQFTVTVQVRYSLTN